MTDEPEFQPDAQPTVEPATYVLGPTGAADVLAAGPDESSRRSRRRAPIAAALAAVVVILIAGLGVTAYRTLSGGGPQPETLAPSTTFAFIKIDFDPAAGQKIAAYRFSRKFPHSPTRKASGPGDIKDEVLKAIIGTDPKTDYDRDIKPWLGDRAALAGFTDSKGKPQAVGIVQVTDKAKAEKGLRDLAKKDDTGKNGYVVHDHYALIGDNQAVVDDAAKLAEKKNLAAAGHYSDDTDALGGDQIVTGWADLGQAVKVAGDSGAFDQFPFSGFAVSNAAYHQPAKVPAPLAGVKGRVALGIHASSDYVELTARTFGVPDQAEPTPGVGDRLTGLPADTVAAVSVGGIAKALRTGFANNPMLQRLLPQVEEGTGLHLPDDLITVLGDRATIALGSVPTDNDAPLIALRSHPADVAAARAIITRLLSDSPDAPVVLDEANGDLIAASDPGYADKIKAGGRLGEDKLFRTAMGDLPASVSAAAFVRLQPILEHVGEKAGDAKVLTAVGLVAGKDGDSGVLRVRVVAN